MTPRNPWTTGGRVLVNGDLAVNMGSHEGMPAADTMRGKAKLRKGWNSITVRIASGSGGFGFWLAIEDNGGLAFAPGRQ